MFGIHSSKTFFPTIGGVCTVKVNGAHPQQTSRGSPELSRVITVVVVVELIGGAIIRGIE